MGGGGKSHQPGGGFPLVQGGCHLACCCKKDWRISHESRARETIPSKRQRKMGEVYLACDCLEPTKKRNERRSNRRSEPSAAWNERLGPSVDVKTGLGAEL